MWLVLAAMFGAAIGIMATFLEFRQTFIAPALTIVVCGFSLVISNDLLRRVLHFVGVILCWTCVMHNFGGVFGEFVGNYYKDEGVPLAVIRTVHRFYWLLTSLAFWVMEVDRINGRSMVSDPEAEELRQGHLHGDFTYV